MYGKTAQSVFGNQNPRIQMKHLSALLAIKIVNQGHGGDIVINNAEIRANESIVGEFKVNITNSVATFDGEGYANSPNAKINMSGNGITIPRYQDGDANKGDGFTTLYLAIKPFTVSKGQSLSILINNSIRTITVTNDIKFESGKVTTLKVPIKHLVNETATDGGSYLTGKTNCTTFPVSLINGKSVSDMFVIGTENAPGSVTISGKLKNVLDILPIGFYAASWNGKQAAMIVDNVKAYIPISKYEIGMNLDRAALAEKINQDESFFVIYPYPVGTFTQTGKAQNLVILDEEPLQKAVDETKANTFIESYGITVAEVRSGINAPLIGASKEQKAARSKLFNLLCQFSAQINNISFLGDAVVCSALKYADCEVTLRTAAINEEKGVDDPRVVMWGLDIKGAQ